MVGVCVVGRGALGQGEGGRERGGGREGERERKKRDSDIIDKPEKALNIRNPPRIRIGSQTTSGL